MLVAECDDYDEKTAAKGVNFAAFKTFQKILIRKLKMEICWTVLRFFGYDNDLRIVQKLWDDQSIPKLDLESARCFELKKGAIEYLSQLYKSEVR